MEQTSEKPKARPVKIKVVNTTKRLGGVGHFLDPGETFGNKIIGPGYSMLFDCPGGAYPGCVEDWLDKGSVVVYDAVSGDVVDGAPLAGDVTRGVIAPVREMNGYQDDDLFGEDDLDLGAAREASMPEQTTENTMPIQGELAQQHHPRTRVTRGRLDEEIVGGEISPIPGDRPRSVDDSEKFTVKAPRASHVGGVIGKR